MRSMTGFGQAEGGKSSLQWSVEIRSLNHRFFDCAMRLPAALAGLEEKVREAVRTRIKRGKITVSISAKKRADLSNGLVLDKAKIRFYIQSLRQIQKTFRLAQEPISINTLLSIPNLFTVDLPERANDEYWHSLQSVIDRAVSRLILAQEKEGLALERDLKGRVRIIKGSLKRIESAARRLPFERSKQLVERISKHNGAFTLDANRLEQEVALWTDRSDITEEVIRASHHIEQFQKSCAASGEKGKKLDFITQEIHREVNTMASKAQSSVVSSETIKIKSELDKIREQIQNVE